MSYLVQRALRPPERLDRLPDDIRSLEPGGWVYSDLLDGWVGYDLPAEVNNRIYKARIGDFPEDYP